MMGSAVESAVRVRGELGRDKYTVRSIYPEDQQNLASGTLPSSFTRQIRDLSTSHRRTYQAVFSTAVTDPLPAPSHSPSRKQALRENVDTFVFPNGRTQRMPRSAPDSPIRVASRKRPRTTQSCMQLDLLPSRAAQSNIEFFTSRSPTVPLARGDRDGQRGFGPGRIGGTTDWACSSSGVSTSTGTYHDGFSDLFVLPAASRLGFGIPAQCRGTTAESFRPSETARPRTVALDRRLKSLGNWPLYTAERWIIAEVGEDEALLRINKLRDIRMQRVARRRLEEAAKPAPESSSDSAGSCNDDDEESIPREGENEEDEEVIAERRRLRKKKKKRARKLERRAAAQRSRWNKERWRTAGRHGGIVSRANASLPALSTRGDLGLLKTHADLMLLAKLSRRWRKIAEAFGVKLDPKSYGDHSLPPPPTEATGSGFMDLGDFRALVMGEGVRLTEVEADIVFRRIEVARLKSAGTKVHAGLAPVASDVPDDPATREEMTMRSRDMNVQNPPTTSVQYSEIYDALFPAEEAETLSAVLGRDEEIREKNAQREALKRQHFEDYMTERRRGEIEEIEEAYVAGLADMSPPEERSAANAGPTVVDWRSDGGVGSRWGATEVARKALYLSLQAGAVAHLPLKERQAAEAPWIKGDTHLCLHATKAALVACAKYGRGFQGLTATQVVLALRVYAAERIQAQWRGLRPRRHFAPKIIALREMMRREEAARAERQAGAFRAWVQQHSLTMQLFRGTRKQFRRWKLNAANSRRHADLFRGTFWPLYVWRRWTNHCISSADKTKFLKKAFSTYVLLRHFRAWNRLTEADVRVRRQVGVMYATHRRERAHRVVVWWAAHARQRKALSKSWLREGMWLRLRVEKREIRSMFVILRYWAFARATATRRSDTHFRSLFLLGEMERRQTISSRKNAKSKSKRKAKREALSPDNRDFREEGDGHLEHPVISREVELIVMASVRLVPIFENWRRWLELDLLRLSENNMIVEDKYSSGARAGDKTGASKAARDAVVTVHGRPTFSEFPGVETALFAEGAPEGVVYACGVLREKFAAKEMLKARVNFLLYKRLGPAMLVRMKSKTRERQQTRFAAFHDARRVQRKYLRAWNIAAGVLGTVLRGIAGQSLAATLQDAAAGDDGTGIRNGRQDSDTSGSNAGHRRSKPGTAVPEYFLGADLLEEDRRTRRAQEERTGVRIERLMGRTAKIKEGSKAEREIMETWLVARSRRERALAKYLIRKGAQARSADENVRQFAAGFRRYAANSLVDVVTRIFTEIVDGRREEILGKHLKMWRSWYMQRISVRLYNRARLRNWLRICGRLRYLWRGMPLYRELRMKWSVFHLLLRSINERLKYGTPGLPTMLGRRRELLLGYSNHLRASGFTGGRYAPEVLLPVTLDELAMMQRWKQHVQAKKSADLVTDSFRKRRHARIVRVVFDGWRTGIGPKQRNRAQAKAAATAGAAKEAFLAEKFTKASATLGGKTPWRSGDASLMRNVPGVSSAGSSPAATVMMVPSDGWSEFDGTVIWQPRKGFAEKRAKADLKVARRTVVAAWRGSLARDIGLRQAKQQRKTKQLARREPTFKKFVEYHTWQATERVRTEARLLVDAFLNRGRLKFQDLETRVTVGRAIDDGISPGELHFHDRCVPGSCLVCEVRVMTRIGEGVVGIQLVMKVGGMRTEELSLHGSAAGESRSTRAYTFTVDAPVERLSRFECEHNKGLIERLRVVTSGGRISAWFGDRLTANHSLSMLPDWRYDSLAATTAAAAAAARAAVGSCASDSLSSDEIDAATRERRAAASEAAAETAAAAAAAPGWDPQKEYVTGLFGSQAHGRLVGLGVITRHVTNSHVFSYLWEAPEDDEGVIQTPPVEALELEELTADNMTKNGSSSERSLGSSASGMSSSVRSLQSRSSSVLSASCSPTAAPLVSRVGSKNAESSMPLPRGPSQVATGGGVAVDGEPGNGQSCMGSATAAAATAALAPAPVLSRAEAKQQKFAREMREREKKKAERERETKQREENLERLMRGGNSADESNGDSATARGRTPAPPTPQEEFASLLRMRRTDARHALERSLALARAARHYRGRFGSDRSAGALNNLSVVMGLTTWFYAALLPQLVPLPVPAATTSGLFHRGETQLMAARAIKARGDSLNRQMQSLLEERQQRPRRGVMSPAMRATEMLERENLRVWAADSAALLEKARLQRDEGERLLDQAREQLPKVSQSVQTIRMYLDSLKLARRQIELEREFGLGALRTRAGRDGNGGGGREGVGKGVGDGAPGAVGTSCGLEDTLFDTTIQSLLTLHGDDDDQHTGFATNAAAVLLPATTHGRDVVSQHSNTTVLSNRLKVDQKNSAQESFVALACHEEGSIGAERLRD